MWWRLLAIFYIETTLYIQKPFRAQIKNLSFVMQTTLPKKEISENSMKINQ